MDKKTPPPVIPAKAEIQEPPGVRIETVAGGETTLIAAPTMSGRRARKRRIRSAFRPRTPGRAPAWAPRSSSFPLPGGRPGGGWPSLAALAAAALAHRGHRSRL